MSEEKGNYAFVDAQNLHFGTTKCWNCAEKLQIELKDIKLENCNCGQAWTVDLEKFRVYLRENYNVTQAYYVLGYIHDGGGSLYDKIQKAGFILTFKEHGQWHKSTKKGNVDTDVVFEVMRNLIEDGGKFEKILLVSNDGDYIKLVQYLVSKGRFKKILHPNKRFASSLYKKLGSEMYDFMENFKIHIQQVQKIRTSEKEHATPLVINEERGS